MCFEWFSMCICESAMHILLNGNKGIETEWITTTAKRKRNFYTENNKKFNDTPTHKQQIQF